MINNKGINDFNGVSLISLVITVIVLVIIASVSFVSSINTIENASFSTYVSGVSDVDEAFHAKATNIRGLESSKGKVYMSSQVYDYLAKDGKSETDYLDEIDLPAYTIIVDNNQLGMKMKEMVLNSGKEGNLKMKYAVTRSGKIFTWPPFENEGKLYINTEDTVETMTTSNPIIGGEEIALVLDSETNELLDGNVASVAMLVKEGKIRVGDYIDYENILPTKTYVTSKEETGFTSDKTLTTDTTKKWRVVYTDMETGEALITPEGVTNSRKLKIRGYLGYINGPRIIEEACRNLYSTDGMVARSMTIEDLNKITGFNPNGYGYAGTKYGKTKTYTAGEKFIAVEGNGISGGTPNGEIEGTSAKYYKASPESPVSATLTYYNYDPSYYNPKAGEILSGTGSDRAWLASSCVITDTNSANYVMRTVYSGAVSYYFLLSSGGNISNTDPCGLRPVVSLGESAKIKNFNDEVGTEEHEWEMAG